MQDKSKTWACCFSGVLQTRTKIRLAVVESATITILFIMDFNQLIGSVVNLRASIPALGNHETH